METQKIQFELPESGIQAQKKMPKRSHVDPAVIFGVSLIVISAICHIFLAAGFIRSLPSDKLEGLLTSLVLPPYTEQIKTIAYEFYEAEILPPPKTDTTPSDYLASDLSTKAENGFELRNETSYSPDLTALYNEPTPIDKRDKLYERYLEGDPLVLVYHTHATESYSDTNDTGAFRSNDADRNVVSVGAVLCKVLERGGIPSIHMTELFDAESYNDAYYNSSSAVAEILEANPSIQYIIDLHRDCIMSADGKYISTEFSRDGDSFAQLMLVIGTDEGGSGHIEWQKNLTLSLQLQAKLCESSPSLMRAINLRRASFYQHHSPGAMLVEFGTCGNTLKEAKNSAVLFGITLSDYILGYSSGLDADTLLAELVK